MTRRILLIGGRGQTGKRIARLLAHEDVLAPPSAQLNLSDGATLRSLLRRERFDAIVIPGAARHIDWCEEHPEEAFAINAIGPGIVAEEARGAHVLYFSTDAVFDGTAGPYGPDAPVNPLSVYGRSKVEGERRVRAAELHTIVRTCHIYSSDSGENFFMDVARRLAAGAPVHAYVDQSSTPTDADSLAEATVRLINDRVTGVVHLAGREMCSRYTFALEVARVLGLSGVEPAHLPGALRGRQAGLVSHLPGYREGIARQARLYLGSNRNPI